MVDVKQLTRTLQSKRFILRDVEVTSKNVKTSSLQWVKL